MKLVLALALAATVGVAATAQTSAPAAAIVVYKAPSCGCCKAWMEHLTENGFKVTGKDVDNVQPIKDEVGLPAKLASCHTAIVDGYVVEGHVPAREIRRLLAERPKALGLAVPGMPVGSPGMDGPIYAGRRDPYDVLLLGGDGRATVYARYR